MVIANAIAYTPEDVSRISDQAGKLYELVGGELVEKQVSVIANSIAAEVVVLLRGAYSKSEAAILPEQPTYCFDDPTEGRRPDVCLVWMSRLPAGLPRGELEIAPDLVVEIVSPTNEYSEVHRRVNAFLKAGVSVVWLIDPDVRAMHVYRKGADVVGYYHATDVYCDDPFLPRLSFQLSHVLPNETADSVQA